MDFFTEKLSFMKSILEQAEMNGLIQIDVEPDRLDVLLAYKKIRIHFKSGVIEEIS